jgi:hypothetical protein
VAEWKRWIAEGKAPATRQTAMDLIAAEMVALQNPPALVGEFLALKTSAQSIVVDGVERLDDSLSFIAWDLSANHGRALNYDTASNYFSGLLRQACNLIFTFTRVPITLQSGARISMPTVVSTGEGAQRIIDLKSQNLSDIARAFIEDGKVRLLRWRPCGAGPEFIIQTLRTLESEILKEF